MSFPPQLKGTRWSFSSSQHSCVYVMVHFNICCNIFSVLITEFLIFIIEFSGFEVCAWPAGYTEQCVCADCCKSGEKGFVI